jgi:hypothetical protein
MIAFIIVLALAGYFGFLVDWKEFGAPFKSGGWVVLGLYGVIGLSYYLTKALHVVQSAGGGHH